VRDRLCSSKTACRRSRGGAFTNWLELSVSKQDMNDLSLVSSGFECAGEGRGSPSRGSLRTMDVLYAEPDYLVYPSSTPNDEFWSSPFGNAGNPGGGCVGRVHRRSEFQSGIIDTGINLSNFDLTGNLWTNPGEIPGNGIDDDGNGYVDDIHGWNVCAGTGTPPQYLQRSRDACRRYGRGARQQLGGCCRRDVGLQVGRRESL